MANKWVWRYKYPKKEKIVKISSKKNILFLQKNNYLISDASGKLFFYGNKGYGALVKQKKQSFLVKRK